MIFIGGIFFQPSNVTAVLPRQILSRSLDACQTLSALDRSKTVRFQVIEEGNEEKGQIYALVLEQCFPGFRPTCLEDFYNIKAPKKSKIFSAYSSDSVTKIINEQTTHSVTFNLTPKLNNNSIKLSKSSASGIAISGNLTSALSASNLLNGLEDKLNVSFKNRERRVSFGVIRAIPTIFTSDENPETTDSNSSHLTPLVLAKIDQDEMNYSLLKNISEKKVEDESVLVDNVTNEYVHKMLQQTMDEVLIID